MRYETNVTTNGAADANAAPEPSPRDILAAAIDANQPIMLMGAPGTAKTAMIETLAAERGAYLEVVIASAQDPTTILGIPMPSEDRRYTEPTIPGWARRIIDADAAGRPTILFLDELTTVPPSVAAPLLGVVQSRRADGWSLPDSTAIVAAANPPDLAVGGWALEPAMANRWVHLPWPAPHAEWVAWATAQGGTLALIAEFVTAVPDQLLAVPTSVPQRSGPWPSPRSWHRAAALIDRTADPRMARFAVGDAAAAMFAAWVAQRDVPSIDALLGGAPLPERTDALRQCLEAVTMAATEDTLAATLAVLTRAIAIDAGYVASMVRSLAQRDLVDGIAAIVAALDAAGAVA